MISEQAKTNNDRWRENRKLEFERRHKLGLELTTKHTSTNHWDSQQEFLTWYYSIFGYSQETYPMWWHGSTSKLNGQSHTWMLPTEHHKLICKLAWG